MALGGVRDEAGNRGHRRTYIGSMPGKLIQKMAKVGVKTRCSCFFDGIDKMSSDMRGDPASALLGSAGSRAERSVQRPLRKWITISAT